MSAQVVFMGPSAAGKTSLMLGLARLENTDDFKVDRTWTTQQRRPYEGDEEKKFVSQEEFDGHRPDFLFSFRTFPTYEYGIPKQGPLQEGELRMRVLPPVFAVKFRQLVSAPSILCSITPYTTDPESIIRARDPAMDPTDMQTRVLRFQRDQDEADVMADIHFKNTEGLDTAILSLGTMIVKYRGSRVTCADIRQSHDTY